MPVVNGICEVIAALFAWGSVYMLVADNQIKGIYWPSVAFAAVWGLVALGYYVSLGHWLAFIGACFRVLALFVWIYISLTMTRL